jgi:hypothetical protein
MLKSDPAAKWRELLGRKDAVGRVARITTRGVVTGFNVGRRNSALLGITAGADGLIWFAKGAPKSLGRINS